MFRLQNFSVLGRGLPYPLPFPEAPLLASLSGGGPIPGRRRPGRVVARPPRPLGKLR